MAKKVEKENKTAEFFKKFLYILFWPLSELVVFISKQYDKGSLSFSS